MGAKRDCFVIMPFSSTKTRTEAEWTEIYENVFRPAIKGCGYSCQRAAPETGRLARGIIEKLRNSYLVLADITDRNANVFYELGVRHSLSKRTIIVAQGAEHTPSDLGGYWFTVYGTSPGQVAEFKKEMKRLVSVIEKDPEQSDNPVSDYLGQEHLDISRYRNTENVKKISALITELLGNIVDLDIRTSNNQLTPSRFNLLSTSCLDLLLATYYIDPGPEVLKDAYELRSKLDYLRIGPRPFRIGPRPFNESQEELIDDVRISLNKVLTMIEQIRSRLVQGQFVETERVSMMVWKPAAGINRPSTLCESDIGKNISASCYADKRIARISSPNDNYINKLNDPGKLATNAAEKALGVSHGIEEPRAEVSDPIPKASLDNTPESPKELRKS